MKKLFNGFPETDRMILLCMVGKSYQKSKEKEVLEDLNKYLRNGFS